MQSNSYANIFLTVLLSCFVPSAASAESIWFNGVVLPEPDNGLTAFEMPEHVVSFSDRAALGVPQGFGVDGPVRITNKQGKPVKRFNFLAINSGQSRSQAVLVKLSASQHQKFTVCNGNRCIRYQVVRY